MMTMGVYVVVLISLDSVNLHGDQLGMLGIASGLSENLYGGQRLLNRKRARKADRDQAHGVNVLYWHLSEKENDLYLEVKALTSLSLPCTVSLSPSLSPLSLLLAGTVWWWWLQPIGGGGQISQLSCFLVPDLFRSPLPCLLFPDPDPDLG
ncbi:hypothetical protein F2Q70_00015936 [Brassica cretica]|uniref:Uncharacterized protein n=1 Tax=Brassica cretica TaxID=69181 RepID=A0A8S9L3Z3_BRACR|nr:hypothetical protein F2Q70_00015936 [Brassica cretica]KAF2600313.1 hypothetical protein F2Q68_00008849 [Brassica cretica]